MPNKTIYVKGSDEELWRRAKILALLSRGGSLSAFVARAVRRFVREVEEHHAKDRLLRQ
jgi:hypothetical protein